MTAPWKTAWITGASSGIGRALAARLAEQGVRVAASARNAAKLEELRSSHSGILAVPLDVTHRDDVRAAFVRLEAELGAIDLAVLNAGIWQPMSVSAFDAGKSAESMTVNYLGIANALEQLIPPMIERRSGHIALVSSVAGYRGLPKAAAYAPTKAAVISLAEVLRLELSRHGITVSLVNPGFVETPMTSVNDFPMPYIVPVDEAADRIIRGLAARKYEIAFPWQLVASLKLLRILPNALYLKLASRL